MRMTLRIATVSAGLMLACSLPCSSQTQSISAITAAPADSTPGYIYTVAGTGTRGHSGDGSKATVAELWYPSGVAIDPATGDLYIADSFNNVIRKVAASDEIISRVAGMYANPGGYSGDGGPATDALLKVPYDVKFCSKNGNYYVADSGNNRIREVMVNAKPAPVIQTVAGNGNAGYNGDGGPAIEAELDGPMGIALDASCNLYISDSGNNVIREVHADTGKINTIAGTGTAAHSGDGGPAIDADLNDPGQLTFDASFTNLYFADSGNLAVRKIDINTGIISAVAGAGSRGLRNDCEGGSAVEASLYNPFGVAVDPAGNLYFSIFSDEFSPEVCKVNLSTGDISVYAGNGVAGYSGDGGAATQAMLNGPSGLVLDASGDLYIADYYNERVREVTAPTPPLVTTKTTAAASPNPAAVGETVTFTANVTATGTATPAGNVVFSVDGKTVDTVALSGGKAVYPTSTLAVGTHKVQAAYGGNSTFSPSSAVVTETIYKAQTAMPVISPAPGTYGTEQLVSVTDATKGAVIYYTTNGATPTASSTKYTAQIAVAASETLKFIAIASGFAPSAVVSASYVIADTPGVLTAPATAITANGATLNALVNTSGAAATYSFQYGLSMNGLSGATPTKTLAAGSGTMSISAAITGLQPKTTYFFRALVNSVGGTSNSAIESFKTE